MAQPIVGTSGKAELLTIRWDPPDFPTARHYEIISEIGWPGCLDDLTEYLLTGDDPTQLSRPVMGRLGETNRGSQVWAYAFAHGRGMRVLLDVGRLVGQAALTSRPADLP
jgi:hypothetical protein